MGGWGVGEGKHTLTFLFLASLLLFSPFFGEVGGEGKHTLTFLFFTSLHPVSRAMRKPTICICENKDADQLRGNREADQRISFRHSDSTIPPILKSEKKNYLYSVLVQAGLCRTCSETTLLVFPRGGCFSICIPRQPKILYFPNFPLIY